MINTLKKLKLIVTFASYIYKLFPKKKTKVSKTMNSAFESLYEIKQKLGLDSLYFDLGQDGLTVRVVWGELKYSYSYVYTNEFIELSRVPIEEDFLPRIKRKMNETEVSSG